MLNHHLPHPLLHPTQSPSRIQSLPQPPIPDIFDTNIPPVEPTLTPPVTLLGLQGEDEPQDPSNIDSQPYEGPSTLNPNSTDDQLQHPSTFPEPQHGELWNLHTCRNTVPELSIVGLTTMPDFDLGDGNFGEEAEVMNRDLARWTRQGLWSGCADGEVYVSNLS